MSDNPNTPQDDADRIRMKRLAKLQAASASSSSSTLSTLTSPAASASASPAPAAPKPKPALATQSSPSISSPFKRPASQATPPPAVSAPPAVQKRRPPPPKLELGTWEHESIGHILNVTLDKSVAEKTSYEVVWLKHLADELAAENPDSLGSPHLSSDIIDRLLIARLEIDPKAMSDDMEFLPVIASLPAQQTIFEYLVGCWKRLNSVRSALIKKGYTPAETQRALTRLEKVKDLIVSYTGLTLQEPEMFPQPSGRPLGSSELVGPLLSLSALSGPLLSRATGGSSILSPTDVEPFLQDLAKRFEPDGELESVLGPVIELLVKHPTLFSDQGLGSNDASWRAVMAGLEALVSVKPIAVMITRMENFNPPAATAPTLEMQSLLGPLCRLGVFDSEWPGVGESYFANAEQRRRDDLESSFASLRGTLKSLQSSLYSVFNTLVRASPQSREAVLNYFARVVALNEKRSGMQVDPATVSSDSFMVNLQTVLHRFAEPFMDATYSKMDRIDPAYYAHTKRIDLKDETRIKATNDEANQWLEANRLPDGAPPPNFISDIFYLTVAMSHLGYLQTIQKFNDTSRQLEDMQRHMDMMNGDGSWMGGPVQARMQAAINTLKAQMQKVRAGQLTYEAQLHEPEFVFQALGFANFLSTWVIRQAEPNHKHPNPQVTLPLPKEVPLSFRVLPEYIIEDIVNYLYFAVQTTPDKFELSGRTELLMFVMTFLTSTWYIKNPFLKSKINDVLFMSIWGYGRERNGILGNLLNTHSVALKHLMPALMQFYIEVEQTGASSQFYDKFNSRRAISYILKVVWNNPAHREMLNKEALNVDKFVRFVNLMINDVTYLMDESLSELTQIHNIQVEMDDKQRWMAQPLDYRREREGTLRSLERHASSYITLGRTTVELLKVFTAETKTPFMMPEIVDRLAAMLDYNLVALVGPKYQELKVREPEKLRFNPRDLLADILQVFLNLSDREEFIKAVAGDGRSYSKALFDSAAEIALRRGIKSVTEVEQLRAFVAKVEEAKATIEAEEDLGEVPDEFLDPLMFTVMRDPVILPSSKAVIDRATIKSHLLSDAKDPFNRMPLSIEDVIPDTELKAKIDTFLLERRQKAGQSSAESSSMQVDS